MTNRQLVSEIKTDLKAYNKDQHVSSSYILQKAKGYVEYLLGQRPTTDVYRDDTIFRELRCFPMEKIKKHKCDIVEFRNCDSIMKSKKTLPPLYNSKVGTIIVSVTTIDGSIEYKRLIALNDYKNQQKRQFGNKFKYYYVANNHLYLLNATERLVNIVALFSDESDIEKKSECAEVDDCKTTLDYDFICPEKYISQVKELTLQNLLSSFKQIVTDENPNLDEAR